MAVAAFDTYAAAKTLREAGFDERQAEAAVTMVRDAMTESVATKADLAVAVADLKADMLTLKTDMLTLKADMLKVAIGIVVANVTLTVALVKLLP